MLEFSDLQKILFDTDRVFTEAEEEELYTILHDLRNLLQHDEEYIAIVGRLLNYNDLKKEGFTKEQIKEFSEKDQEIIKFSGNLVEEHFKNDHEYMFGYPANMMKDSYVTRHLRWLESRMYFTNSCGNAYCQGNYRMNNAKQELEIIEKVKENLGLEKEDFWGYITMGGTEGNMWGIREGFSVYPDGKLYYSDAAHYSVSKMADMVDIDKYEKVGSTNEKINVDELIGKIKKNYEENNTPAILLLTFGTTTLGSIDDIDIICNKLNELQIPHYIHVDAALYGGIPKNQVNSPAEKFYLLNRTDINSISVSLHKYVGNPKSNGVLLSKTKSYQKFIDYIGSNDITFCGSRDFPTFSLLQRVEELYSRSTPYEYEKNVKYFEKLLNDNDVYYIKGIDTGNVFIINKPSDEVCKKYQLASFTRDGIDYAHVIVFPYHSEEVMDELINDLVKCKKEGIQRQRKDDNNGNN